MISPRPQCHGRYVFDPERSRSQLRARHTPLFFFSIVGLSPHGSHARYPRSRQGLSQTRSHRSWRASTSTIQAPACSGLLGTEQAPASPRCMTHRRRPAPRGLTTGRSRRSTARTPLLTDRSGVRAQLGYLPQEFGFYPHLTGEQMLLAPAAARRASRRRRAQASWRRAARAREPHVRRASARSRATRAACASGSASPRRSPAIRGSSSSTSRPRASIPRSASASTTCSPSWREDRTVAALDPHRRRRRGALPAVRGDPRRAGSSRAPRRAGARRDRQDTRGHGRRRTPALGAGEHDTPERCWSRPDHARILRAARRARLHNRRRSRTTVLMRLSVLPGREGAAREAAADVPRRRSPIGSSVTLVGPSERGSHRPARRRRCSASSSKHAAPCSSHCS